MSKSSILTLSAFTVILAAFNCSVAVATANKCSLAPLPKGTLKNGLRYGIVRKRILASG